jgi:hypothetical protein
MQLDKHKALYSSTNSYSQEMNSATTGLSPLKVLKTAIQLHQKEPREVSTADTRAVSPLVQAQIDKCSPAVGSTSACSALAKFERNA